MKLAIFDKDGTLVTPKSGEKFVQHPEDQMLLPGVAEGIAAMAADGWVMAIASNQGGVAAGHKTLDDAIEEMRVCLSLLTDIKLGLFCPDFEGDICMAIDGCAALNIAVQSWGQGLKGLYRKPHSGMIEAAHRMVFESHISNPDSVLFVGDRPEDEQAAANAGVRFQWANKWRNSYLPSSN
jgi:D-glycero-D-manno-heptose 1,7-bisphosphate phosphatase